MASRGVCKECGRVTIRVSWSSLRAFEECRQKAKLRMQGKRAVLDDTRGFFAGNVTDRTVRNWLQNNPDANLGVMPDMVNSIIDEQLAELKEEGRVMRWKSVDDRERVRADCIEAVTKIEPYLVRHVLPFEYKADYKFQAPIQATRPDGEVDTIMLNGYMDIFVRHPRTSTWAVLDVKHTRDDGYWRKTVGQLGFYDLAVELMEGTATKYTALLQPLCKKPIVMYQPTPESRVQLMQRIHGMARALWLDDMPPKPDSDGCAYCDVRNACSKFAVDLSSGKKRVSLRP